jgi:hypothetical protein
LTDNIIVTPPAPITIIVEPTPSGEEAGRPIVIGPGQGGAQGPVGPAGPAGPQGEQGIPGPSLAYVHTQNTPASAWTINHNLGIFPQVSIIEIGGANVEGEVIYLNNNSLTVSFTVAISGTAYIS